MKIKEILKLLKENRYQTLAGTLSFFFILSFIPLAYLSLFIYSKATDLLNLNASIIEELKEFLSFDLSIGVSIVFIIITIYSSSSLFFHLRQTGDIIYKIKKPEKSIAIKIASIIAVLLFLLIINFALLSIALANQFFTNKIDSRLLSLLIIIIIVLMFYLITILLNKYASPKKLSIKNLKKGTLVTLIYIFISSIIFYFYLTFFADYNFLYGYLTTIIIFLMWVYLIMKGIVIGIIINYGNNR